MGWRHRDWLWLLACIIYASGFSFVNNSNVVDYISYVSTGASIALAGVAIYISVREATKSDRVKDDINLILGELKEKIGQVDNKVSGLDVNLISDTINHQFKDLVETLSKVVESQDGVIDKGQIKEILKDKLNTKANQIKEELNEAVMDQNAPRKRYYYTFAIKDSEHFDFVGFSAAFRNKLGITKKQMLFKKLTTNDPNRVELQISIIPDINIDSQRINEVFLSIINNYKSQK